MKQPLLVPILVDHDVGRPIGFIREEDGKMFIQFNRGEAVTKDDAFGIFGGAGLRITASREVDGEFFIEEAEIVEFSLCPCPRNERILRK